MLIQGEGGPSRPSEGRRLVERAAALGEIDALRVLAHAFAHGTFTLQRSARRAKQIDLALDRALQALRKDLAGQIAGAVTFFHQAAQVAKARAPRGVGVEVADINLTQADADVLLAMEKHKVDDTPYDYPSLGGGVRIPLQSLESASHSFSTSLAARSC